MSLHSNHSIRIALRGAAIALLVSGLMAGTATTSVAQDSATQSRVIRVTSQPGGLPQKLSLSLNKAVILELDRDARDVMVANPEIADAVVRTPRRIFILSLSVGQTNAIFLDGQGQHIATVEISVSADVDDLNDYLRRETPDARVTADGIGDGIVLSGEVASLSEAGIAQNVALRSVEEPEQVVNNLTIHDRQQVLIKVRVSEMTRSIAKQFGVNPSAVANVNGVPVVASSGNSFSLLGRALSDISGAQIGLVCQGGPPPGFSTTNVCAPRPNNLQAIVQGLERIGLVRTLAEPNLTAVSGESARFLAGGEFPVPTSRDRDGNVAVEFKPFGVGLAFTPVVLSKGRISLQLSTEVSELTNAGALTLNGGTVTDSNGNSITTDGLTLPALQVRRTETTVELPSGGSLVIGGLIQQQTKQNIDAFPGVQNLPVLGALFRSRDFQNNETELVVTVTAYLVDPVAESQLVMPDQGYSTPTDLETILFGRLNTVYPESAGGAPAAPGLTGGGTAPDGSVGYIVQ